MSSLAPLKNLLILLQLFGQLGNIFNAFSSSYDGIKIHLRKLSI